jgi:hypothetical protein
MEENNESGVRYVNDWETTQSTLPNVTRQFFLANTEDSFLAINTRAFPLFHFSREESDVNYNFC